ncbi:hypothetical protein [Parvibaculum sp. MBR-TMA-1.3b-4.2]
MEMGLARNRRNFMTEQVQRDAELESLLHSLTYEIDRQRLMIRALAYGAIGSAVISFLLGALTSSMVT